MEGQSLQSIITNPLTNANFKSKSKSLSAPITKFTIFCLYFYISLFEEITYRLVLLGLVWNRLIRFSWHNSWKICNRPYFTTCKIS